MSSTRLSVVLLLAVSAGAAEPNAQLQAFRRQAHLRLAEKALSAHNIDGAQQRLEAALELARNAAEAPELGRILERLGDIHLRRNQLLTAKSFYERALDASPDEAKPQTFAKLGQVATRRGRHAEAAERYGQALSSRRDKALFLRLGEAGLRAGLMDEARQAFDEAISETAAGTLERAALHESVARRYLWLAGDRESAGGHAQKALEIRRARKGEAPEQYIRALRSKAARTSDSMLAETFLAELPAPLARQIRARRLEAKSELEQAFQQQLSAVQELRKVENPGLDFAAALEGLAALQAKRGNGASVGLLDEALDLRRELRIAHAPESLAALDRIVSSLERQGRSADAESVLTGYIRALQSAEDKHPLAISTAQERYGDLLLRDGRSDEASRAFQTSIQLRETAWGDGDGRLQPILEKYADALRRGGREEEARGAESQIALLSVLANATREPPQGRRDTGTWLSEPAGLSFIGLALAAASLGAVWLGWSTFTGLQPAFESGFRPAPPSIADAPAWRPVTRPQARYPVSFRGRGGPLFGIWSVNMALTLITLGFYFFWGKIRTRRYFWSQAELAGDRFTFRGTGAELLFGWMKAAPVLALVLWGPGLLDLAWENPNAGLWGAGIALTLLGLLWPLAEIGATRYRLSRTSWRAIRFSFRGAAWPYMKIWLMGMPLWLFTLGLWTPFFDTARRRYLLQHTQFGDAKFTCDVHGKDLFAFYVVSWLLLIPTAGASHFWYKALAERYYWSRTQLIHNDGASRAGFECTLKGVDLLVLWIQTTALVAVTLGLGWPWTRVWEARLRLQTLALTGDFRPGRIRQSTGAAGAAGEGAADFLGLDFGFFA